VVKNRINSEKKVDIIAIGADPKRDERKEDNERRIKSTKKKKNQNQKTRVRKK